MNLETRIKNLENLVNALIKRIDNDKFYSNADTSALRQTDNNQHEVLEQDRADIDYIAMETGVDL